MPKIKEQEYPIRYIIGMVFVSFVGFTGTSSITVLSAGLLSAVALVLFALLITSIPMVYFVGKDFAALNQRGVDWPKRKLPYYLFIILLPSWVMTPAYLIRRGQIVRSEDHVRRGGGGGVRR